MHYFNCVCLKDFFRKKIMWTNEKLTKEQFVGGYGEPKVSGI